jgi:hypothetical protein
MVGNPARGQMENCLNLDSKDYGITLILAKGKENAKAELSKIKE